jgi:hypothetical protein
MRNWRLLSSALRTLALIACAFSCGLPQGAAQEGQKVNLEPAPGQVKITIAGKPFAIYSYDDKTITRPYFAHVHAPGGVQVTRNHPPVEGSDLVDHPTFHPGIWMSFGDISGNDYWRLQAPVRHVKFVEEPAGGADRGSFAVENSYRGQKNPEEEVCREVARYEVRALPGGYLLLCDSTFSGDKEFSFGDQEEMGLGFRVATPIRAERKSEGSVPAGNGEIRDAQGRVNEQEIWGNAADWCDYTGQRDGQTVGLAILCHPKNFRPSWFHARDYGMLEANPFGRAAFGKGNASQAPVRPGETMRLRYGVFVHAGDAPAADPAVAYNEYIKLAGE